MNTKLFSTSLYFALETAVEYKYISDFYIIIICLGNSYWLIPEFLVEAQGWRGRKPLKSWDWLEFITFILIKLVVMHNLILFYFVPAIKPWTFFIYQCSHSSPPLLSVWTFFSLSTFPITFHLHIFQCQLSFHCFCTTSLCYHFLGHFHFPFVPFLRPCFQFQLPLSLFFFNIKLFAWLSAEPAQIRQFIMTWLLLINMSHYWLCYRCQMNQTSNQSRNYSPDYQPHQPTSERPIWLITGLLN